jgi:hypothetical protein
MDANERIKLFSKIANNVYITGIDNCWIWKTSRTNSYVSIKINGIVGKIHRVMYELLNGEIPVGMVVMHTCNNKNCCAPRHLRLGTTKENMKHASITGRLTRSSYTKNLQSEIMKSRYNK